MSQPIVRPGIFKISANGCCAQGIPHIESKLGYPKDRSICLQSLPLTSHLYGLEARSSRLRNTYCPTEMEKSRTSICLAPFLTDMKSFLRVREQKLTMILVTNWPT